MHFIPRLREISKKYKAILLQVILNKVSPSTQKGYTNGQDVQVFRSLNWVHVAGRADPSVVKKINCIRVRMIFVSK